MRGNNKALVFIIALFAAPPVARAQDAEPEPQVVILVCEPNELPPGSSGYPFAVKIKIDRVNRTVDLLASGGTVLASTSDRRYNALPPMITFTEEKYSWKLQNKIGTLFDGFIDRHTRDANFFWDTDRGSKSFRGRCKKAPGPVL